MPDPMLKSCSSAWHIHTLLLCYPVRRRLQWRHYHAALLQGGASAGWANDSTHLMIPAHICLTRSPVVMGVCFSSELIESSCLAYMPAHLHTWCFSAVGISHACLPASVSHSVTLLSFLPGIPIIGWMEKNDRWFALMPARMQPAARTHDCTPPKQTQR